jgi:hypothetical protein
MYIKRPGRRLGTGTAPAPPGTGTGTRTGTGTGTGTGTYGIRAGGGFPGYFSRSLSGFSAEKAYVTSGRHARP